MCHMALGIWGAGLCWASLCWLVLANKCSAKRCESAETAGASRTVHQFSLQRCIWRRQVSKSLFFLLLFWAFTVTQLTIYRAWLSMNVQNSIEWWCNLNWIKFSGWLEDFWLTTYLQWHGAPKLKIFASKGYVFKLDTLQRTTLRV